MKDFLAFISESYNEDDRRRISDYIHKMSGNVQQVRIDGRGMVSTIDHQGHKRQIGSINRFAQAANKATSNDNQAHVSVLPKAANDTHAPALQHKDPAQITKQDVDDLKINKSKPIDIVKTSGTEQTSAAKENDRQKAVQVAQAAKSEPDHEILDTNQPNDKLKEKVRLDDKQTKAAILDSLKTKFPGTKFSYRKHSYSMGSSANISWQDGPHSRDVESHLNNFKGSVFDGMTDMKDYISHDVGGKSVSYAHDHLFSKRNYSKEHVDKAIDRMYAAHADELPATRPTVSSDFDKKGFSANFQNGDNNKVVNGYVKNFRGYGTTYASEVLRHFIAGNDERDGYN